MISQIQFINFVIDESLQVQQGFLHEFELSPCERLLLDRLFIECLHLREAGLHHRDDTLFYQDWIVGGFTVYLVETIQSVRHQEQVP
jgi:hypothetical protein